MKIIESIERIQILHKLMSEEKTGTPNDLAQRLGISRSTLYNLLEELKAQRISIAYSRTKESFFYLEDIDIEVKFSVKIIRDPNKLTKIRGGGIIFSFCPIY